MGLLRFPRAMTITVLDSQHRSAAIETAVREDNARKKGGSLGDESIVVILFIYDALWKTQQKFIAMAARDELAARSLPHSASSRSATASASIHEVGRRVA